MVFHAAWGCGDYRGERCGDYLDGDRLIAISCGRHSLGPRSGDLGDQKEIGTQRAQYLVADMVPGLGRETSAIKERIVEQARKQPPRLESWEAVGFI
jgi:hypothetical protein